MPIPNKIRKMGEEEMNEATWLAQSTVELLWCIWPRRCHLSNKWMFYTLAYRARITRIVQDNHRRHLDRWYDCKHFIMFQMNAA